MATTHRRRRQFVFESLTDSVLDAPAYHFVASTDSDTGEPLPSETDPQERIHPSESSDGETADYLQTIYQQLEQWLTAVQQRWQNAPHPRVLRDFQKNIRFLTRLLKQSRYPRLALIGRRGAGKSSVINALLGQQVAEPESPRHVGSPHLEPIFIAQTGHAKILMYRNEDGSGLDVLDTRGINEGGRPVESDEAVSAVESIVEALRTCPVDAILYIHKIKVQHALANTVEVDSGVESDLLALDSILQKAKLSDTGLPVVVVLTHADEIEPSDLKRPEDYDDEKLANIESAKQLFLKNVAAVSPNVHKHIVGVEAVSCAVIWQPRNEQGEILPHPRRDYRYNIDELLDLLLRNVQIQAVFRMVQASRMSRVKVDFAEFLVKVFATIAAVLALTPIPTSDILPLTALTSYMIYTIARLANQPANWDASAKFLGVVGMTGMLGYGARYMLSQAMKFVPIPGMWAGSAVISFTMTTAVGKSAIAFFLENKSEEEVRRLFDEYRQLDRADEVERLLKEGDPQQETNEQLESMKKEKDA